MTGKKNMPNDVHPSSPKPSRNGGDRSDEAANMAKTCPSRTTTRPSRGEASSTSRLSVPDGDRFQEIEALVRRLLTLLGEDPARPGLTDTPSRVARSLRELTRGYQGTASEAVADGIFEEDHGSVVIVRGIELFSLCEHHMLPFFGRAHVGYMPNGRVVGLSKLARIVEVFARRLQVQERLTDQIARALESELKPEGVGVVVEARHLCMMMRGVEKHGPRTVTRAFRGSLANSTSLRNEVLRGIG